MPGIKRALLIGINYFDTSAELAGCHADIDDMIAYLNRVGFSKQNILTLRDSKEDPKHLRTDCPTRENILAAMSIAILATKPGDTLYIHYSGHGAYKDDSDGDEADGQDECICPVDYDINDMIYDDELNDVLVNKLVKGAKLRAVFDCCHSGTALDLPIRWVAGQSFTTESGEFENKDIIFISGCRDDQTSADSYFNGRPNGALTWAYLKALDDIKKSGVMSTTYRWKDLGEMIRLKLRRKAFDQVPQICAETRVSILKYVDLI